MMNIVITIYNCDSEEKCLKLSKKNVKQTKKIPRNFSLMSFFVFEQVLF